MVPDEFQRGLIYTVDPRIIAPLATEEEYRIVASTRFRIPKDEVFTGYESLYRRARGLIDRRQTELTCASSEMRLHTWITSHGWFRMEMSDGALVGAVVTLGISCASPTAEAPRGQEEPTPQSLQLPYVAQLGRPGSATPWFDEFYNDFDMRKDRARTSGLTISYGEYAPSRDDVDVTSLVARADERARSYIDVVRGDGEQLRLARREWTCLDTGKSAKPFLAHVDLTFT